jgi:hypothetical protein
LIEYWECLTAGCVNLIASGKNNDEIREIVSACCRMQDVPFNEMKHNRNIDNVSNFIRRNKSGTRLQTEP